jgi:hypothetical protein
MHAQTCTHTHTHHTHHTEEEKEAQGVFNPVPMWVGLKEDNADDAESDEEHEEHEGHEDDVDKRGQAALVVLPTDSMSVAKPQVVGESFEDAMVAEAAQLQPQGGARSMRRRTHVAYNRERLTLQPHDMANLVLF